MKNQVILFNQVSSARHLDLNKCLKEALTEPVLSKKRVQKSSKRRFKKTFNTFVYYLNHLTHKSRELVLSSFLNDHKNPKIKKIINKKNYAV